MSLVTCCPACSTMFKVVPDQLRISHGWVRCGHCSEVFDAAANMQPRAVSSSILSAVPPEATRDASGERLSEPPGGQAPNAQFPVDESSRTADTLDGGRVDANPADALLNKPWPDAPSDAMSVPLPVPSPRATEPRPIWKTSAKPAETSSAPDSEPFELHSRFHELPEPSDSQKPAVTPQPVEPLEPPVSFVRAARRQAFWRRTGVRLVLSLLLLVALVALALQVAHQERNRLAALYPQTRPWLVQLCEHVPCTVGPLQQIESIVIDSSSFNKLQGGSYRLSLSLKNQSALPLAMPAVELTLTDSQDQPVLRRVLQPTELGSKTGVMDAAGTSSSTLVISVSDSPDNARIAGYRVLAFYP